MCCRGWGFYLSKYEKIRPVHEYPDIFESANVSLRIQKFPGPHVSVFNSNLLVHTYLTRIRIHSSTQDSFGNIGNRACVVRRAKFASRIMAESVRKSKKNSKSKVDFLTGKRENLGTELPSRIQYSR